MRRIDLRDERVVEVLTYCVSGGIAVLMHWAVYAVLLWCGVEVHLAYTLGYATSWCLNFYLNSRYTFHAAPNAKRAAGFGLTHFCNYILEMLLLEGFLWMGVPKVWAYVPIQIIVVPITFVMVRLVFRSSRFEGSLSVSPLLRNSVVVAFMSDVLLAYAVWMVTRVVFVADNWSLLSVGWSALSVTELLRGSLLFDTSALCAVNSLFVVLFLLPLHLKERTWWHGLTRVVYVSVNALCVIANLCDTAYFRFTGRRTTATVFSEFAGEDNLLRVFAAEAVAHWYLLVIGLLLIYALWRLYRTPVYRGRSLTAYYTVRMVSIVVCMVLCVAGLRGGFSTAVRPVTISNAGQYVNRPIEMGIVLNTPFCIMRTLGKESFEVPRYYDDEGEMERVYTPVHRADSVGDGHPNVVVLIVESLGREYVGALNATTNGDQLPSFTPFIDSLCTVSLTFDYSFCNGRKSIDGMPAILSGIPMFVEPFVLTSASMNSVGGLATELGHVGYHTAFFHGAQNGSMGFQAFARSTGFEEYYGRTEYEADSTTGGAHDYDGTWAIWDEPFLQYYARVMGTMREPFFTSVFTASSHHPFVVPEEYRDTFPDIDDNALHKCIRYADHSLRRFFATASRQPWYDHTIFVITGDHTNLMSYPHYATDIGIFATPIIIYDPSGRLPRERRHAVAQHIDIMPTLLNHIGTGRPYVAFGKDLLSTPDSLTWAVNYCNGVYLYVEDSLLLQWDGERTRGLYNIRSDWFQRNNIAGDPRQQSMERRLKAIVQSYMERMTEDRLVIRDEDGD